MKRTIISALAISAAFISVSCQKDLMQQAVESQTVSTFTAISEGVPSKTTLDGLVSKWNADHIYILNGNNDATCKQEFATEATGTNQATFSIVNKEAQFSGEHFIAICPSGMSGDAWWNAQGGNRFVDKLWLTPTQTATAGTYDANAHVSVAYSETSTLEFKNTCALLKFTVSGGDVASITIETPEYIAGNFNFDTKDLKVYNDNNGYSRSKSVTLSGDFIDGQTYYMAVLPGSYSSLTLKVNDVVLKSKNTAVSFKRNTIYDMGSVSKVVVAEKEIKMTVDKQNDWENLYIYAWDSSDNKPFGDWPGKKVTDNTVTFPASYNKADVFFIFSNGAGIQTSNQQRTLNDDFTFELPADPTKSFIVIGCPFAEYLYMFRDNNPINGGWPGTKLNPHSLYNYKYCSIDGFVDQTFNFIVNNNSGTQTKDLWTGDNDYLVKKNGSHYYTYQDEHKK